jgi:hypothetical protein
MEGSYRPNYIQIKYSLLCNLNDPSYNISRNLENGLLAYVHSIMSYGITFWGNQPYSDKIFKIQKRAIRIITNSRTRDPCRELFKKLEILPLYSQYIFSISMFVIKNKHLFHTNNHIHSIHTRFTTTLHPLTAHLTKFQNGVYYLAINIFNISRHQRFSL